MSVLLPLGIAFAMQAAVTLALYSAPVIAPAAAGAFGLVPSSVGYFVSAAYVGSMMGSLLAGVAVSRFGPIRVSQFGLLSCSIGLAIGAAAASAGGTGAIALVLFAAFWIGMGYGPAIPAGSVLLSRAAPPSRVALIFAIKQTGVPAGAALAGAVLPSLILAWGWRWSTVAIALACTGIALAAEPARKSFDLDQDTTARLSLARIAASLRLVFREKRLAELAVTAIAYGSVQMSLASYFVTFLIDTLSVSLVVAGFVLSCSQIGAVAGRLLWAALADRLGNRTATLGLLGLAMGLLACAIFALDGAWPIWLLSLFAMAFGAAASGWTGVYLAEVAARAPAGTVSEVTGACMFLGFLGAVASPPIFHGLLSLTGSYAVPYALFGAIAIAAGTRGLSAQIRAKR